VSNADLVRSYLAAFASGDADTVAGHVSDDFENIQVGELGTGCTGKATYRQRLEGFLSDFEGLKYEVHEIIVDGDKVAAAYRMNFTQGDKAFDIPGVMVITVSNGKIAVRRDYWDGMTYQRQVGEGALT